MGEACSGYGGRRGIYRVLGGEPEGKRPLGRPRHVGVWPGSSWLRIGTGGRHL